MDTWSTGTKQTLWAANTDTTVVLTCNRDNIGHQNRGLGSSCRNRRRPRHGLCKSAAVGVMKTVWTWAGDGFASDEGTEEVAGEDVHWHWRRTGQSASGPSIPWPTSAIFLRFHHGLQHGKGRVYPGLTWGHRDENGRMERAIATLMPHTCTISVSTLSKKQHIHGARITCVCNGRTESGKQATHTRMVGGKQTWHPIVIAFYQISCVTRCKCGAEYGVDRPHNAKVVSVQERKNISRGNTLKHT
jgi:hypothetical protein